MQLFNIPLFKRVVHSLAKIVFMVLFASVALQPLCGELGSLHFIFFSFHITVFIDECLQFYADRELWAAEPANYLSAVSQVLLFVGRFVPPCPTSRSLQRGSHPPAAATPEFVPWTHGHAPLLLAGSALRCSLIEKPEAGAPDFLGWLDERSEWKVRGGGERWRGWGDAGHDDLFYDLGVRDHGCKWDLRLEVLRWILALEALMIVLDLHEIFTVWPQVGVLLVCTKNMLTNLLQWFPLVMVVSLGFGIALNILAPAFKLHGSPGAFRPIPWLDWDASAAGPFFAPFWAMFGFYEPGEVPPARRDPPRHDPQRHDPRDMTPET